ncbi:MAG: hypothetical protein AAFQ94_24160, partial [Bacteroidota bacterium]
MTGSTFAQNQQKADSLILVLSEQDDFSDSLLMVTILQIILYSSQNEEIIKYAELLIGKARKLKLPSFEIQGNVGLGIAYRQENDIQRSLSHLFKAATLATKNNRKDLLGEVYFEITTTYAAENNMEAALTYERKGIELIRQYGRAEQVAIALLNIGFSYYDLKNYDSALYFYNEAEPYFDSLNLTIGKAYLTGNKGLILWKHDKIAMAEEALLSAIKMLRTLGDDWAMADYHNNLSQMYFEHREFEKSLKHANNAYELASALKSNELLIHSVSLLSKHSERKGDFEGAYAYQKRYTALKDSISDDEISREIADMRTKFEIDIREYEISLLEEQQKTSQFYILVAIILLALAIVLILFFRQRAKNQQLATINERRHYANSVKDLLKDQENKALESMVQGRDNERKRLAQELHNHFGSLLATIKVNINAIEEDVIPNHETLSTLVDQACTDMRSISHSLNMGVSENFGLVPALRDLINHLQDSGHLQVEFEASMCDSLLSSEYEIIIYRIIQELVSNVLKHAEASKITILLTCYEEEGLMN